MASEAGGCCNTARAGTASAAFSAATMASSRSAIENDHLRGSEGIEEAVQLCQIGFGKVPYACMLHDDGFHWRKSAKDLRRHYFLPAPLSYLSIQTHINAWSAATAKS